MRNFGSFARADAIPRAREVHRQAASLHRKISRSRHLPEATVRVDSAEVTFFVTLLE
jgi:hypothetical protein